MVHEQTDSKTSNTESLTSLNSQEQVSQEKQVEDEKVTFISVVLSVIQASFGVQNKKNRERDFKSTSLLPFVVAAAIFTLVFVLFLMLVVQLVLP